MPNRRPGPPPGRRFRPGLWPTIATAAFVAVTVGLGNWQYRRAEYKAGLAAEFAQAQQQGPLQLSAQTRLEPALRYRTVHVAGRFVPGRQVLIDNRVAEGRVGYQAVAPLQIEKSDAHVLVDRGWVPAGATRAEQPDPVLPAAMVVIVGRLSFVPAAGDAVSSPAPEGRVWQRIDIDRMAAAMGVRLLPAVVEQIRPTGPGDDLVRVRADPEFGIDRHRGYMVQWYALATLAIALWAALNWRRGARGAADAGRGHGDGQG